MALTLKHNDKQLTTVHSVAILVGFFCIFAQLVEIVVNNILVATLICLKLF